MSCVKRAIYSVIYHKGNNLLLFGIFTLILTLVLSSICVRNAANKGINQIGKSVNISVLVMNHKDDTALDFFSMEMSRQMEKLPQVNKGSYQSDSIATANDFKPYFNTDLYAYTLEILPEGYSKEWENGNVNLIGITDTNNYWFFQENGHTLLEGRHLVKEDEGMPYAIISKVLADMNHLAIGDTITLQSFNKKNKVKELEIVGIHSGSIGNTFPSYQAPCNYIFTPVEFADYLGPGGIKIAEYTLQNTLEAETFIDAAQVIVDQGDDNGKISFETNNLAFLQASSAMKSLINVTNAIMVSVILMGGIILCLMVLYSMLGRFFEVGVLLALGERRIYIALQMIIEVLLPLIPAIPVSIVSSNLIAGWLSEKLGNGPDMLELTVLISKQSILIVCVCGLVLAITACFLPIKRIMKYQPKKLLQIIE